MNDVANRPRMREGFVAEEPKVTTAAPRQPTPQQLADGKARLDTPPPEIEASPAEADADKPPGEITWPLVVPLLHKPLTLPDGRSLHELTFREPRGSDINMWGNPVRFNREGDMIIDERKMHYILAQLAGLLAPQLNLLDTRDWNSCAYKLARFFMPEQGMW